MVQVSSPESVTVRVHSLSLLFVSPRSEDRHVPACSRLLPAHAPACSRLLPACSRLLPLAPGMLPACSRLLPACSRLLQACSRLLPLAPACSRWRLVARHSDTPTQPDTPDTPTLRHPDTVDTLDTRRGPPLSRSPDTARQKPDTGLDRARHSDTSVNRHWPDTGPTPPDTARHRRHSDTPGLKSPPGVRA